jgi:hypothetical protein
MILVQILWITGDQQLSSDPGHASIDGWPLALPSHSSARGVTKLPGDDHMMIIYGLFMLIVDLSGFLDFLGNMFLGTRLYKIKHTIKHVFS